jgi:hypothetical protein
LILLAQLGGSISQDERIKHACTYYLDASLKHQGQVSYNGEPSGTFDCLQGNMCAALVMLGYEDPLLATAFEWMARTVTSEGIAPADKKEDTLRYYSAKCGPSFG